jgi:hypothetical protein
MAVHQGDPTTSRHHFGGASTSAGGSSNGRLQEDDCPHLARAMRRYLRRQQMSATAAAAAADNDVGNLAHTDGKPKMANADATVWLGDSAASHHVTGDCTLLTNTQPANVIVTDVGGSRHRAGLMGTVELQVPGASGTRRLSVPGVLFVLGLQRNLFFVGQTLEQGFYVRFDNDVCTIAAHGDVMLQVSCRQRLFPFSAMACPASVATAASALGKPRGLAEARLWHRRLGHLGYDNVARASRLVAGFNVSRAGIVSAKVAGCDICDLAKQCARPFPPAISRTTSPLQLIHMEFCGPMPEPALGGGSYWLTLLDDFSSFA